MQQPDSPEFSILGRRIFLSLYLVMIASFILLFIAIILNSDWLGISCLSVAMLSGAGIMLTGAREQKKDRVLSIFLFTWFASGAIALASIEIGYSALATISCIIFFVLFVVAIIAQAIEHWKEVAKYLGMIISMLVFWGLVGLAAWGVRSLLGY
jgi:hypothetical protein